MIKLGYNKKNWLLLPSSRYEQHTNENYKQRLRQLKKNNNKQVSNKILGITQTLVQKLASIRWVNFPALARKRLGFLDVTASQKP